MQNQKEPVGGDQTWLRFTCATLIPTVTVVAIGGWLSYGAVEKVALNAGFEADKAAWFPLTLDLPVLVGYAGAIALRGRPSVYFARFVLAVSGAATVAIQAADAAGMVAQDEWLTATIHAWPPLSAILCVHLFVLLMQSLGFLVPPVTETVRPPAIVRLWSWTVDTVKLTAAVTAATSPVQPGSLTAATQGAATSDPGVNAVEIAASATTPLEPAAVTSEPVTAATPAVTPDQVGAVNALVDAIAGVAAAASEREAQPPRRPAARTSGRERDLTKIIGEIARCPEPWLKADGGWAQNKIEKADWSGLGEEKLSQRTAKKVVERLVAEGVSKVSQGQGSGSRTEGKTREHTIASPTEMALRPLVPSEPEQDELPALHLVSRS